MPRARSRSRPSAAFRDDADRSVQLLIATRDRAIDRRVEVRRELVEVAAREPPLDRGGVDVEAEVGAAVHRRGERLRAAHAAETAAHDEAPGEIGAEVLPRRFGEGLVRALQDPLCADVDPGPGGHLAVHHEALLLELAEVFPRGPLADEVRVRDQTRGASRCVRTIPTGLPDCTRSVSSSSSSFSALDDGVERGPVAGRLSDAAVHDEILRTLRDLGIEVVHEHAERRFLHPSLARTFRAPGRANRPSRAHDASPLRTVSVVIVRPSSRRRATSNDMRTSHSRRLRR
jgi:hypothetical protein